MLRSADPLPVASRFLHAFAGVSDLLPVCGEGRKAFCMNGRNAYHVQGHAERVESLRASGQNRGKAGRFPAGKRAVMSARAKARCFFPVCLEKLNPHNFIVKLFD